MFRSSGWSIFVSQLPSHVALLGTLLFAAVVAPASAAEKPKVRTITAFIRLDTTQYKQQVTDTLTMLRNAKARFELAGYEVQTIRISAQPFPEYTHGMLKQAILAFFHDLDNLAKQENFIASIGPALMSEKDDPAQDMLLTVTGRFLVKEIGVAVPPGRLMGELGFLSPDNRRTATIECTEDGQVLTITYEKLLEIYFQNPQFGYYFLVLTSQRLLENISRLETIVAQNKAAEQAAAATRTN